jgi:hypothetical protein
LIKLASKEKESETPDLSGQTTTVWTTTTLKM